MKIDSNLASPPILPRVFWFLAFALALGILVKPYIFANSNANAPAAVASIGTFLCINTDFMNTCMHTYTYVYAQEYVIHY